MDNIRYDHIDCYTMKCRLYLNDAQKEQVDKILRGIHVFYNCTLYKLLNDNEGTQPGKKLNENGEFYHLPNYKTLQNKAWKEDLIREHPIIAEVPAGAITGNNGCIGADLKKALDKHSMEYHRASVAMKKSGKLPRDRKVPSYYSKNKPRTSYTYQETCSKFTCAGNRNVIYANLNKLNECGKEEKNNLCKLRGWNHDIRFAPDGSVDFIDYLASNPRKQLTVTISKDNCGDHWICFKLLDVYKPIKDTHGDAVGVDVGIKDIAILSDGTKFENHRFKKKQKRHLKLLNRQMSRRHGWSNIRFREQYKGNPSLVPSKRYEQAKQKHAKLERKIVRQRENWNNTITRSIVENHDSIAVESLNVKGMQRNRHLAYALSDAAIGDILSKLAYKAVWHRREIRAIDRWTPSSKRCSCCGYIKRGLKLSEREWTCPSCRKRHDRDINAAINILDYAFGITLAA